MKFILKCFLIFFVLIIPNSLCAQVGINTATPDPSSILDIFSNSKGVLMPRLDQVARDAINDPANGLMIFNTSTNDSQINIGADGGPANWKGVTKPEYPMLFEITESGESTNTSTSDLLITGMTLSVVPGTYTAFFNAQLTAASFITQSFGSSEGANDLTALYDSLLNYSDGITQEVNHAIAFGGTGVGEFLPPGIYTVAGAPSISGKLTLAGGTATENPIFIIKASGAFTTAANTEVILTGNAKPENIFWLSGAAMSTGANTIMKGTMIGGGLGAGAIALGADTVMEGRLFSKLGAISVGANSSITSPTAASPVSLGSLSTFAMFSSSGNVSDVVSDITNGDTGAVNGTLSMVGIHNGVAYSPATISRPVVNINTTTYSFYQNNILVANSTRTIKLSDGIVNLQATIIVSDTDTSPTEIRWRVKDGDATIASRNFSMIRATY
ncbi:ice-binding family protein [Patiriisocius sp. Uisw_017]|jgi:hypothetical protein|uniref:ice-binding family protein n=1 Tax=Patiriisocius sp. Uisw_017 TaxID=3230968 RepID=UPI0039EA0E87